MRPSNGWFLGFGFCPLASNVGVAITIAIKPEIHVLLARVFKLLGYAGRAGCNVGQRSFSRARLQALPFLLPFLVCATGAFGLETASLRPAPHIETLISASNF
jgi:hypothetical protein